MITLTIPWPVSSNRYWRSFVPRGGRRCVVVLSDEAKKYRKEVHGRALEAGITRPLAGRVAMTFTLYPALPKGARARMTRNPLAWDDTVRSIDLDNALKVAIDSLKHCVITDDRWVWEITARRAEPDGVARMVVTVSQIETPMHPQLAIEALGRLDEMENDE